MIDSIVLKKSNLMNQRDLMKKTKAPNYLLRRVKPTEFKLRKYFKNCFFGF